jgi:hypothetical protein
MAAGLPSMSDIMAQPGLPGIEGITLSTGNRDPWEFDEAGNFFKYNLSKIEFQRSSAIAQLFDACGRVDNDSVPDVWHPLKDLTKSLLPHLEFSRVETANYDNMRCLFHVHGRNIEIDFDELSSGEKAVLQQLYPIIEPEILKGLQVVSPSTAVPSDKQFVIIDEPELHLHPSLQEKLVAYLRTQAVQRSLKVLLATHSPTIIDAADQDDIYLLRPTEAVPSGENQIVPLGREPNRLTIAQEAIGAVFPVTAARPLLFVEGSDRVTVKAYSDKQILTFLDPRFHLLNIIPNNGKEECLRALASARSVLKDQPFGLRVYALLDRDFDEESSAADGAFLLPSAMIENLLLSVPALRAGFGPMLHRTPFEHDDSLLRAALDNAVTSIESDEVRRRFRRKVRFGTFGPDRVVVDAETAVAYREEFKERLDEPDFGQLEQDARDEVAAIVAAGNQLKLFSGKAILNAFFEQNVAALAMNRAIFVYGCAQEAASEPHVRTFVDDFFEAIGLT